MKKLLLKIGILIAFVGLFTSQVNAQKEKDFKRWAIGIGPAMAVFPGVAHLQISTDKSTKNSFNFGGTIGINFFINKWWSINGLSGLTIGTSNLFEGSTRLVPDSNGALIEINWEAHNWEPYFDIRNTVGVSRRIRVVDIFFLDFGLAFGYNWRKFTDRCVEAKENGVPTYSECRESNSRAHNFIYSASVKGVIFLRPTWSLEPYFGVGYGKNSFNINRAYENNFYGDFNVLIVKYI